MNLNLLELAWAAGFFDGEGAIFSVTRSGHLRRQELAFTVSQIDRRPLDRFRAAVMGLGHVRGPYQPRHPNGQPVYVFTINGHKQIQAAIALLWRFLSEPKREDAVRAFKAYLAYHLMRLVRGTFGRSSLTAQQVVELRAEHAKARIGRQRVPQGWLIDKAKELGISTATATQVISGLHYGHVK